MIENWFRTQINAFLKPKETFAQEKTNASIEKGIANYLIAGIISWVVSNQTIAESFEINPLQIFVYSVIFVWIYFFIAKALGGKGSFTSTFYLSSLYAVPLVVAGFIPLANILFWFYGFYLMYYVLIESQELTAKKARIAILLPLIVIAIAIAAIYLSTFLLQPSVV